MVIGGEAKSAIQVPWAKQKTAMTFPPEQRLTSVDNRHRWESAPDRTRLGVLQSP